MLWELEPPAERRRKIARHHRSELFSNGFKLIPNCFKTTNSNYYPLNEDIIHTHLDDRITDFGYSVDHSFADRNILRLTEG